jgi:glycerophosphoryl diester phosphodiesterase
MSTTRAPSTRRRRPFAVALASSTTLVLALTAGFLSGGTTSAAAATCTPSSQVMRVVEQELAGQDAAIVVSHRGRFGPNTPENSIASLQASAAACDPMIELDVKETSDGVPVVMHDYNLGRTTDQGQRRAMFVPETGSGTNPRVDSVTSATLSGWRLLSQDRRAVTTEVIPTVSSIYDRYYDDQMQTVLVWDVKSLTAVQSITQIVNRDNRTYAGGRSARDITVMKVNATLFPTYRSYVDAVAGFGMPLPVIPIYTSNTVSALAGGPVGSAVASVRTFIDQRRSDVPSIEVNLKTDRSAREALLRDVLEVTEAAGVSTGVFNAVPDYLPDPSKGSYKNTGECCYTLAALLVSFQGVTEREDRRGDRTFLDSESFNVITTDQPDVIRNYFRSIGRYQDRPIVVP